MLLHCTQRTFALFDMLEGRIPNSLSKIISICMQVHLILRHKSPKTGKIEEKHLTSPPFVESDSRTHVYTAILRASNNSYAVLVDGEVKKEGSLFEDFEPPINPPETIPDPEDKKPEDWVDEAR
jgi:hypothetical protein